MLCAVLTIERCVDNVHGYKDAITNTDTSLEDCIFSRK